MVEVSRLITPEMLVEIEADAVVQEGENMQPTSDQLAAALSTAASGALTKAVQQITHCLDQLTDEQVWWRPSESMNSIGNLILHLCGNLRQWIVAGIGGELGCAATFEGILGPWPNFEGRIAFRRLGWSRRSGPKRP